MKLNPRKRLCEEHVKGLTIYFSFSSLFNMFVCGLTTCDFCAACIQPWPDSANATCGWMCAFMPAMTQAGFSISQKCLISRPQPPGLQHPPPPQPSLKENSQAIHKYSFCIQSPKQNADGSGNEAIIMHITDIKRNELKSLHI